MAAAERECEAALAAAEPGQVPGLRAELADTHRQTGELIANACEGEPDEDDDGSARSAYEEALAQVDRAVNGFTEAGPDFLDRRTAAELVAAWLEADLGRRDGARARARRVLAVYEGTGAEAGDTVHARRAEAESVLGYVDRAPHK